MHIQRRPWFVFVLPFVLLVLVLGGWGLSRFLAARNETPHSGTTYQKLIRVTPTVAVVMDMASAHLFIPTIGVNAPVEAVGVLPSGNMEVPTHNQWEGVGWYQYGPQPGQHGSAVIDGHLDRPGGAPAVFWNLQKLHSGDLVKVSDNQGHIQKFSVTKIADFANNASTQGIFNDNSGTYLNLITCAGTWIPAQHQTTLRLVVYAKLIQ